MSKSGQLRIDIDDSGLSAEIVFYSPGEQPRLSFEEVREAIEDAGVEAFVAWDKLEDFYQREIYDRSMVFAEGREMEPSDNGRWQLNFPPDENLEGVKVEEDGSVDFRNIRRFNNVNEGEVLAEREPPREGKKGMTVTGREIPVQKVSTRNFKAGRNVREEKGGRKLVAEADGHVTLVGNKISVLDRININSDIDYAVGSLDFGGDLVVRGDVQPGFQVSAGGDLRVSGVVEKAGLKAGGELEVRGLIFGKEESRVEAGGDARLNGAESTAIRVRGDLEVDSGLRHCETLVGGSLNVRGSKPGIVGGSVSVLERIETSVLGGPMSSLTRLELGMDPILKQELDELAEQEDDLESRRKRIELGLQRLERLSAGSGLSPGQKTLRERFGEQLSQIKEQLAGITERADEIRSELSSYSSPEVVVRDQVYPGVMIWIRGSVYKVNERLSEVRFGYAGGKIRLRSL